MLALPCAFGVASISFSCGSLCCGEFADSREDMLMLLLWLVYVAPVPMLSFRFGRLASDFVASIFSVPDSG